MLKRLLSKKALTIVGVNTGTSCDGLDIAVIRFTRSRKNHGVKFITGATVPFTKPVKHALENLITSNVINAEEITRYDIAFGKFIGRCARKFLTDSKIKADLITSHGQTIGHFPKKKTILKTSSYATLQIGDGNAIATEAKLPVVNDFRRTDIALGGEGAPLTPFVNQLLFGHKSRSRVIVNIGGIANFSYHPSGRRFDAVAGGDCGPGNTLIDSAMRTLFSKTCDIGGEIAQSGLVVPDIVKEIRAANKKRGVSAGREQFTPTLLARIVFHSRRNRASKEDIIASITAATVECIYSSLRKYLKNPIDGIYLTGGGRRNLAIVRELVDKFSPVKIFPVEALGYDGDLLEAVSFAVLGGCYIHGIPSTLPAVTKAKSGGIAGKLALPTK